MTVVSFSMAYRSFRGGSGRLDTQLDTPPSINRRHPVSCLARLFAGGRWIRTFGSPFAKWRFPLSQSGTGLDDKSDLETMMPKVGPRVRIHFAPPVSLLRTRLPR